MKMGDLRGGCVLRRELGEQIIQRQDQVRVLGQGIGLVDQLKSNASAPTFKAAISSGRFNENPPHRLCRRSEKMTAVVPGRFFFTIANQPQERFMHQRGRL